MRLVTWLRTRTPSLGWCHPTHTYRAEGSPVSNVNSDSRRDGDGMGKNILDRLEGGILTPRTPPPHTPPVSGPKHMIRCVCLDAHTWTATDRCTCEVTYSSQLPITLNVIFCTCSMICFEYHCSWKCHAPCRPPLAAHRKIHWGTATNADITTNTAENLISATSICYNLPPDTLPSSYLHRVQQDTGPTIDVGHCVMD